MEENLYKLVIELTCPGCSNQDCGLHQAYKLVIDKKTGLEVRAICICKNHLETKINS